MPPFLVLILETEAAMLQVAFVDGRSLTVGLVKNKESSTMVKTTTKTGPIVAEYGCYYVLVTTSMPHRRAREPPLKVGDRVFMAARNFGESYAQERGGRNWASDSVAEVP